MTFTIKECGHSALFKHTGPSKHKSPMAPLSAHGFLNVSSVPPVVASVEAPRSSHFPDGLTTVKLLGACGVSLLLMRCFFLRR